MHKSFHVILAEAFGATGPRAPWWRRWLPQPVPVLTTTTTGRAAMQVANPTRHDRPGNLRHLRRLG